MIQVSFAFIWKLHRWTVKASAIKLWRGNYMVWASLGPIEVTLEIEL